MFISETTLRGDYSMINKKESQYLIIILKVLISLLVSFLITCALYLKVDKITLSFESMNAFMGSLFALPGRLGALYFVITFLFWLYIVHCFLSKTHNIQAVSKKSIIFLVGFSLICSIVWIFGRMPYYDAISKKQTFFVFVFSFIGFFVLSSLVWNYFCSSKKSLKINEKLCKFRLYSTMNSHRFITCFLIMFILWLPWILALSPGVIAPNDTLDQMQQLYGIESTSSRMAGQLRDGFYLNNHHPVIHTLILGAFLYGGQALCSASFGMFLFVLFQVIFLISSLAFIINAIFDKGTTLSYLLLTSLFIGLVPIFPIWSCCVTKDILFIGCFVYLLGLLIFKENLEKNSLSCKSPEKLRIIVSLMIVFMCILSILLRNSGIYIVGLALAVAFFLDFKNGKFKHFDVALGLLCAIVILKCVYPVAGIAPASNSESLAPQFAQVSRIVIEHEEEIDENSLRVIDENLGLENIRMNYLPNSIDSVKFNYNQDVTSEQKKEFTKVWFDLSLKYPKSAFKGWMELWRGYWSPSLNAGYVWTLTTEWPNGLTNELVNEADMFSDIGLDIQQAGISSGARIQIQKLVEHVLKTPVGLIINMGFYSLVLIFVLVLIFKKKIKDLYIPVVMIFLSLLIYFMAPVDGLYRYVLPCMILTPIMLMKCLDSR